MKTKKDILHRVVTSEKGRKTLIIFFVLIGAAVIYFFWSGVWLPKIESPGGTNELEGFNEQLETSEEVSRVLTPLQGLADAAKSLGEIVPDGDEESETVRRIKDFSKKVWDFIYEKLP